jgi:hypothetical protein
MIFANLTPIPEVVERVRQYGDRFLGFYAYDELGGKQLDQYPHSLYFSNATDYVDAANRYEADVNNWLFNMSARLGFTRNFNSTNEFRLFTSDYALYWFDYQAGYDVVFAEFAWNYNRQLNIALCRGAATAQGKEWGTMITWMYNGTPYLESGPDLYNDMVLSYENGAKYTIVFDTDKNYTESTLTPDRLEAIQRFWQYTQANPRGDSGSRVAYMLPEAYAYGFRGPSDRIWGIWPADVTSVLISQSLSIILQKYGAQLDIIYNDPDLTIPAQYDKIILWNNPYEVINQWPVQSSTPSPTPSPSPPPSVTASPTPSPSATPQTTTTPPTQTFTQQPTPTITPDEPPQQWQTYLIAAATAVVACIAITALAVRRKLNVAKQQIAEN